VNNWLGHGGLVGSTGGGKTYLAKILAEAYMQSGRFVLVYDPVGNNYPCHFETKDIQALVEEAKHQKCCGIFVDESRRVAKDEDFDWLFTEARNWGHECHFICQRYTQVPPVVRENIYRLMLFRCNIKSAMAWDEELATNGEIAEAVKRLQMYQFVEAYRLDPPHGREKVQISKV
jgi:hypothetical protein